MRLASHILAVFLAVSTVVSPCLASITAEKTASEHRGQSAQSMPNLVISFSDDGLRAPADKIGDEIQGVCNGPCARLMSLRNIQSLRGDVIREIAGIEPVTFFVQPIKFGHPPAIRRLASQTRWNSVDIFQICRQLN